LNLVSHKQRCVEWMQLNKAVPVILVLQVIYDDASDAFADGFGAFGGGSSNIPAHKLNHI